MENLNTIYGWIENNQIKNHLTITDETVNDINDKLLAIFRINKLSDENEVNAKEAELAKIFGKYDDIMKLNNSKTRQPLSLASVMAKLDSTIT